MTGVDAGHLLEHREADTDNQRQPCRRMAEPALGQGLHVAPEVGPQLPNLGFDVGVVAAQPTQRGPGLVGVSVAGEPAGCLRQEQHPDGEDHAGHPAQAQHPSPRAASGEAIADQVGDQDAQGDGKLVERHQRAPLPRRGDFGKVERCQHGGAADADPDQQAAGEEQGEAARQRGHDRAHDEHRSGRQ
jgi:hypothetical protein